LHGKFVSGATLDIGFRLKQLKSLLRLYEENNDVILDALRRDMNKSKLEAYLYEVDLMKNDVRGAIRNLKSWTSNVNVPRNILTPADKAYYVRQPFGVVRFMRERQRAGPPVRN
jgi:aldehyde dehydrogenase (NAD+)